MTNEELQERAVELSTLNSVTDSERIRAIETEIVEYETSLLDNRGGKAYFPLLKRSNGVIPLEDFWDIFTDVLVRLLKDYAPAKNATFTTAFSYLLNKRTVDYWKRYYKENKTSSFSSLSKTGDYGEEQARDIPDDTYAPDRPACVADEFELFLLVAPLVALRKEQEKHLAKSKKSYFEGFYTFDAAVQTQKGLFDEDAVISENDVLFPIMEVVILEYLLDGAFVSMKNVVKNSIKDEKRMEQRNETIRNCYSISKPTVVNRNKLYRQLFDAVNC